MRLISGLMMSSSWISRLVVFQASLSTNRAIRKSSLTAPNDRLRQKIIGNQLLIGKYVVFVCKADKLARDETWLFDFCDFTIALSIIAVFCPTIPFMCSQAVAAIAHNCLHGHFHNSVYCTQWPLVSETSLRPKQNEQKIESRKGNCKQLLKSTY